ncbi:HAMP domain-containing sensor histidine kinase [Arthrobacter sp. NEB 688]|uniref:sensor histidine kinase n=1 Tax=Arthrobacter sp. NEB 688 TaxID=904039 RepID=UPI001563B289|nr:HAMP domain-containing sensor histidine kinase [Arthrobacter sp. NEB 688]QKE83929.1 HAMP domain-containing histidine kinase [Arthrobacter sp. NEB 688]
MVWGTASRRREEHRVGALFLLWLGILVVCGLFLLLVPSVELAAVEIVVLSFAVLYGFGSWPVVRTVVSVTGFAVVAAAIMLPRVLRGDLPAVELVEVVTPVVLAAVVTYHVRRRDDAIDTAEALATADRRRARARERLGRMTSHELRTPLTIARGYVDHLAASEPDDQRREDLTTVREELDQLTRLADRLVRAVSLDLGAPDVPSDAAELLDDVRRRWSVITDRELVVRADEGPVALNPERLRAALDTLVENSVRYTGAGDRICLFSESYDDRVEVGVEDSGPGMSADLVETVNRGQSAPDDDEEADVSALLRDAYSQTGFGLRIVQGIARSAGGHLVAGRGTDGGARVALVVPRG